MRAARTLHVILIWLVLLAGAAPVHAAEADRAAKIKSAYLLNFIRFAKWPASAFAAPEAPLSLCVAGRDTLSRHLDRTMQGQAVEGRPIRIRRLDGAPEAAEACHLLFLSEPVLERTRETLRRYAGPSTLTVGETLAFADRGAMLALNYERDRIVFYANPGALRESTVHLSSKILQLARMTDAAGQTAER